MRRIVPLALLFLSLLSCGRDRYLPAGPLAKPSIRFEHAIYLPPSGSASMEQIAQIIRRHGALLFSAEIPRTVERMTVASRMELDVQNDYPPPDPELLKVTARGLTPADAGALRNATHAIALEFAHPQEDAWRALREATELTADVARATGGLIFDKETREVFTLAEWERRRLEAWKEPVPDVSDHIVVHFYQQDEFVRAVSLGMAKFGLPDIVMDDITWSIERPVLDTINLVAQALVEGTPLAQGGTLDLDIRKIRNASLRDGNLTTLKSDKAGAARLLIIDGNRDEGDPDNRLIEIAFDSYPGSDFHAKREAMLDALFGSSDATKNVAHDEAVLAASRKAREQLPALRAAFNPDSPRKR